MQSPSCVWQHALSLSRYMSGDALGLSKTFFRSMHWMCLLLLEWNCNVSFLNFEEIPVNKEDFVSAIFGNCRHTWQNNVPSSSAAHWNSDSHASWTRLVLFVFSYLVCCNYRLSSWRFSLSRSRDSSSPPAKKELMLFCFDIWFVFDRSREFRRCRH